MHIYMNCMRSDGIANGLAGCVCNGSDAHPGQVLGSLDRHIQVRATVRGDVIVAVRTDTMIIANSIQINATTHPPKVIGALSP